MSQNYYQILGLNSSASAEEIRRAYRILARRYHPDVNPGKTSEERFKSIAEAYATLSDTDKRTAYDSNLDADARTKRAFDNYDRASRHAARFKRQQQNSQFGRVKPESGPEDLNQSAGSARRGGLSDALHDIGTAIKGALFVNSSSRRSSVDEQPQRSRTKSRQEPPASSAERKQAGGIERLSLIEVSVSIHDAIYGVKKTVEIAEPEGSRKVSVKIPPGVRNGSVVRLRAKSDPAEDMVLIIRVASHPFLSIQTRGLVAEIPITPHEALAGASISVPTLEEPVIVRVTPGSQSGSEIRVKGRGVFGKDGSRGDLFIRLMIQVPESPDAVGLREKAAELDPYFSQPVRSRLPKSLVD